VKILALDTATENCSAALLIDGTCSARAELLERGHAERILVMIDELLAETQLPLSSLTAIAFGRGPGAFTGLRLAASVTQGLAFGAGLPVVPVSDLAAVAQRTLEMQKEAQRVLVCSDARMGEVYWGCFERAAEGLAGAVGVERVDRPDRVVLPRGWSRGEGGSGVFGAGKGFALYPELRTTLAGELTGLGEGLLPSAAEIALLAVPEVAAGRIFPAEQALPVYLRDEVVHPRHR